MRIVFVQPVIGIAQPCPARGDILHIEPGDLVISPHVMVVEISHPGVVVTPNYDSEQIGKASQRQPLG